LNYLGDPLNSGSRGGSAGLHEAAELALDQLGEFELRAIGMSVRLNAPQIRQARWRRRDIGQLHDPGVAQRSRPGYQDLLVGIATCARNE